MDTLDPAGDFLRIAERYRRMSDEELLVLMPQSSELTPVAQQALASEVRSRGLKAEVEDEKPSASPQFKAAPFKPQPAFLEDESAESLDSTGPDFLGRNSSYDEERKLVDLCNVYSVRDALKLQVILDERGIPFFIGPEKATRVDGVTSNFSDGLAVQIMRIGMPWAMPAMQHYEPEDDPTPTGNEEPDELLVRCPKCRSTEVVFEGVSSAPTMAADESSEKYQWTCDACGRQWEDDGVARDG